MKLNLLPQTVSKERKAKTAWLGFIAMVIIGIGGATGMVIVSNNAKDAAHASVNEVRSQADQVSATAASADEIIKKAQGVMLNANLARAMIKHNDVYADLYQEIRKYIPPFYRLNHISAVPGGDASTEAIVTLTGTLDSFQQYVDLPLALLQIPNATSVSPSGFATDDVYRPGLTEGDQLGKPHKGSEGPVPDDQIERIAYFESNVKPGGYLSAGNFGSDTTQPRGAMPTSSLVTVTIVIAKKDIRTPNPRATLAAAGGGATAGATPVGGPPVGGAPAGGAGSNPAASAPAGAAPGGPDGDEADAKSLRKKGGTD